VGVGQPVVRLSHSIPLRIAPSLTPCRSPARPPAQSWFVIFKPSAFAVLFTLGNIISLCRHACVLALDTCVFPSSCAMRLS
jgi:hypothetical protein